MIGAFFVFNVFFCDNNLIFHTSFIYIFCRIFLRIYDNVPILRNMCVLCNFSEAKIFKITIILMRWINSN